MVAQRDEFIGRLWDDWSVRCEFMYVGIARKHEGGGNLELQYRQ